MASPKKAAPKTSPKAAAQKVQPNQSPKALPTKKATPKANTQQKGTGGSTKKPNNAPMKKK
jgi:hypothetical protein